MRTLSEAQITAQKADNWAPSVHVQIGDTTYTQAHVVYCEYIERVYGGTAVVRINNSDNDLDDSDLKGSEVEIQLGYSGDAGRQEMAHLWVYSTREISIPGEKLIEVYCVDNWHKLGFLKLGIGGVELAGTLYGDLIPGRKLVGDSSGASGIITEVSPKRKYVYLSNVSGTFTDSENAVDDRDSGNYVDISGVTNIGSGGPSQGWDKTSDIDEIIGSDGTAGTLLYGTGVTWVLDDTDGIVDAYKPRYMIENILRPPTIRQVIQDLLGMTKCGFRMEANNDLHVFSLASTPDPVDFTYELDGDYTLFENLKDLSLMIPNRIVAYCIKQTDDAMVDYAQAAQDDAEVAAFIACTDYLPCDVDSDAEALAIAEAAIHRLAWSKQVGGIKVPMNIGQELFDYISIIDTRMGVTYNGYVGGIIRHWEPGVYEMTVELGNLEGIAPIDGGDGRIYAGPNRLPESVKRHSTIPFNPMPAIQPFVLNLVFTATSDNDIKWDNGTASTDGSVQFANGETQVVTHGTLALTQSGKYYLYIIKDTTALQNSQTFSDTVGADRGIVAITERSSTATEYASIVSLSGDMFHVGEGGVHIAKLSAINADMGLLTAGEIRVGTGTIDDDFTGWRMWVESSVGRFAGYNDDVMQFYSDTDGKLYAAGGKIVLDEDALHLHAADSNDKLLIFYDNDNDRHGYFQVDENDDFELHSDHANVNLLLVSDHGRVRILSNGTGNDCLISLEADYISIDGKFGDTLLPSATDSYNIGSDSYRWRRGYFSDRIAIGDTLLSEAQLIALLALL